MTEKYDMAILGGGPGGYTAAIRARQLGFSVCLIEESFLGGTCLNVGCIPTKSLIHSATLFEQTKGAKTFGVNITDSQFDWTGIRKYKDRCVLKLRKGVETLMKQNEIDVVSGHGVLKSVDTIDVEGKSIRAGHIILAPGSYARSLPSLPIDGKMVISSDQALSLEKLPKSILIVGAGAIGCEFAYVMSALGVDVTMVELLDRALPMDDEDISVEFEQHLKRRKIKLHVRSSVEKVEPHDNGVKAFVKPREGGEEFAIDVDQVLVSVGRGPSTENIRLERAGIPVDRGLIKVDDYLHTGIGNVRAVGDAVGGLMLAHKAAAEGILAVELIAGKDRKPINYHNIPRATYAKPEVASVGLNEHEAREKYSDKIKVSKYPFSGIGKAVVIGEGQGFAKLIAAGDDKKLVGAHAIGPHATDLIAVASTAVSLGITAEQFAHVVQAHPTLSEIWMEAAHGLIDGPINFFQSK
jgi:dihydrolipoamide dehydrogenase